MPAFGIGAAVRRSEDYRLLTGHGRFADDVSAPGQLRARDAASSTGCTRNGLADCAATASVKS